ncbi:pentatricopeptide repeat-containing protein At5g27110-like isoform X1 [Selaginella moellendorffii]|uniref:pentatricopeptide repeat-containing protein At5g27110-like isoform X1 n=1 Tax=Selaginella moellendorffii TaxID=88036 RepID=UPI000D1CBB85|nr:pentatricopeptide repeat-containing protein At5g27110-like isoform X1 [Selaginella moellendorffii]XP_024530957.1 pentatricopeptide repeat-containing protein At5g27110-like isoform X1 [Selaginella moellendorffii]|eukprot:XP_024530956.1 pentatricopeptide repeat-containing protein At5g27110-like isoform X1 [Selaginella moellendorffii]
MVKRSISSVLYALKLCMSSRDLSRAKKIHADIIESGHESDLFVASTLVTVYSKCGSLVDACNVFNKMKCRDVVAWNNIILAHEENGEAQVALELFEGMEKEGFSPGARTFVAALKACSSVADGEDGSPLNVKIQSLEKGMVLNSQAATRGFVEDTYVSNTLVDMYGKCGSMLDARRVFDSMRGHDVVSWTALILGYADNGEPDLALVIFEGMKAKGCRPNALTFVAALKACVGLVLKEEEGKKVDGKAACFRNGVRVHSQLAAYGFDSDILVVNTLMDMYFKCGRLVEARAVLEWIPSLSVVSWTVLTLGYAENGEAELALDSFSRMAAEDCLPNSRTFIAAFKACNLLAAREDSKEVDGQSLKVESLKKGIALHSRASKIGCDSDIFLANTLIDMYASCGSMIDAWKVFAKMPRRTVVSWNALMLGFSDNGQPEQALSSLSQMDCPPDSLSFVAAFKASGSLAVKEDGRKVDGKLIKTAALQKGQELHSQAVELGRASDILVANTLLDMYMKCGSVTDALKVFEGISPRTLVSWAVLILGYAENNEGELALEFYERLKLEQGFLLDALTFVAALRGCTSVAVKEVGTQVDGKLVKQQALKTGMEIYSQASKQGYGLDLLVTSTLLDLYTKCGSMTNAREVFGKMPVHNSASWNSLLLGYAESGEEQVVLELFDAMKLQGVVPDVRTYAAALKACTNLAAKEQGTLVNGKLVKAESLEKGMAIHAQAAGSSGGMDMFVYGTLVDMYAKCGSMADASRLFLGMEVHDVVSWTSLMAGYADNGEPAIGLELLDSMDAQGGAPNALTFLAALKACGAIAAIQAAVGIHARIYRSGMENSTLETCLLDAYGKSGSMDRAQRVFDHSSASTRNPVTWNALIAGYSRHGDTEKVFHWFQRMLDEGHRVDAITWTSVLSACSHAGLVHRGEEFFREMLSRSSPGIEHYHCVIDMLSRYNRLEAALAMAKAMPCQANEITWTTILGACWKWKNVEVAKVAFESLQELEGGPVEGAGFVLISNIYETMKAGEQ